MSDLKTALSEAVAAAFAAEGLPAELGRVTASDRPDLADFQSNGALPAAKRVGRNPRAGAETVPNPRRVIVDYGGPNVAKPMHVGHLRASIIGESIKRTYRFRGDEVVGDAHFGDWGYQMGLLIGAVTDENPAVRAEVDALNARTDLTAADLASLEPAACG